MRNSVTSGVSPTCSCSTIQPVMFVVPFAPYRRCGGLALPPGVTYVDYLLPDLRPVGNVPRVEHGGRSPMTCAEAIDRFRSMPMARPRSCWGERRDLVRNILIIGLMWSSATWFQFSGRRHPGARMRRPRRSLWLRPQLDLRVHPSSAVPRPRDGRVVLLFPLSSRARSSSPSRPCRAGCN